MRGGSRPVRNLQLQTLSRRRRPRWRSVSRSMNPLPILRWTPPAKVLYRSAKTFTGIYWNRVLSPISTQQKDQERSVSGSRYGGKYFGCGVLCNNLGRVARPRPGGGDRRMPGRSGIDRGRYSTGAGSAQALRGGGFNIAR